MNKVLTVIKNVESDFKSNNEKYNSYLELGSSYFAGNEYDKAISIFEKAIEEEPKNSGGWIGKAITHLAMTDISEINSVNISDYIEKATKNSETSKIKNYIDAITLHYGYQYSIAIERYIQQTNNAIAAKKKAQVAAVIGIATAVAGGAIANKSNSFTGSLIGYSMLTGGAGLTIKNGYDSFSLDKLSKSLYGNALAQSIVSIPTIQTCFYMYENSSGDIKQNAGIILDSWKDSVIKLFQNEKANFVVLINELSETKKLLHPENRYSVLEKVDEILFFMDMIGLDNSKDFNQVLNVKNVINEYIRDFDEAKIDSINSKRSKSAIGCGAFVLILFALIGQFENIIDQFFKRDSGIPGIIIIVIGLFTYLWFTNKQKKIKQDSGINIIQEKIKNVSLEFSNIVLDRDEINLNLLGT
ncbi:MAG TPA: hypothetical protein PKD16_17990 [Saprospiraceae bacterium]|jgi:tetratricopeptide (TPR) repeat protein|nr:hypothetical protein [Saprospiraceae bacterium]HMT72065.1 hypothetical protein [Saprospiraceae bacterium]